VKAGSFSESEIGSAEGVSRIESVTIYTSSVIASSIEGSGVRSGHCFMTRVVLVSNSHVEASSVEGSGIGPAWCENGGRSEIATLTIWNFTAVTNSSSSG
jgi:hypothetical protein